MSILRVNTLQDVAGTGQPALPGAAKAWVNFNGTGTVAIGASFNVSSITDLGVGTYQVNFTSAMTDVNYVVAGAAERVSDSRGAEISVNRTTRTTSGFNLLVNGSYGTGVDYRDSDGVFCVIYR